MESPEYGLRPASEKPRRLKVDRSGKPSPHAIVRRTCVPEAIQPLRHADLEQDQASVWNEWESSGDQALREVAASDRLRLGVVTVVPVTSNIARVCPIQVLTGPT